ncbi:hypothetical protein [Dyella nitratireducens]|uniref:Uncharacterized protein n=1 Tax=Dyella nitratireducens TaxID=1849580 RepID=A0ABQ1FSV3_9GAMM|nr:hypothetical protein [Dyella nitratireducens]GGA29723.1 hypothetical protein GCM10010981_18350 [Dyella nitratireducens]GLQ43101.1 hypothetical protein GCM10007902_29510 [Dyella nitratireducens]
MKKDIIRTSTFALTLMLGAAVATPSIAQPATMPASAHTASFLVTPTGYQPTPGYLIVTEVGECEHVTHKNFCYCTGACHP